MSNSRDEYEVTTGFWDRGHFRAAGETVLMTPAEAQTHVFAGCITKRVVAPPARAPIEAPSNAG